MIKIKRWATICLAVILALAAIPLPVLANDSVGILTIFSSTNGSSSGISKEGHSWLSFVNTSSAEIKVGVYSVKPMEELTIGKWRAGEKNRNNHSGIWYNRESELINNTNDMLGRASLSMEISMADIEKINKHISSEDNWKYEDNCSTFASNVWNDVSPTKLYAGAIITTPTFLFNSISGQSGYKINRGVQNPRIIMSNELVDYGNNHYQLYSYSSVLSDVTEKYIGKTIAIKSLEANRYVSANTDKDVTGINAAVNRTDASTWEYFDVIAGDYGVVGFKAHANGNYLSARIDQNEQQAYIQAAYGQNYTKPQSWESFRIFEKDGIQFIQSVANGKWVQAATNETDNPLKAAGTYTSTWERFKIEITNISSTDNLGHDQSSDTNRTANTTKVSQHYHGSDYNEGWYEGEWSNDHPNGWGKITYDDFDDGKYYSIGDGTNEYRAQYYEGNFSNGWRVGYGTVVYSGGWKDEGTFYGQWQAGKVVFKGKRWYGNGYWPLTITASSATLGSDTYGEWVSSS